MKKFNAKNLYLSNDDGVFILSLSDSKEEPIHYTIIQKHLQPSQEDIDLGLDKLHVESSDFEENGYNFIKKITISSDNRLNFFRDENEKDLALSIGLELESDDINSLRKILDDIDL